MSIKSEKPKAKWFVYVGKYRPQYGYAEWYKGQANYYLHARALVKKQCKVGDKVILRDTNNHQVVRTGRVTLDYERKNWKTGKPLKTVVWDK